MAGDRIDTAMILAAGLGTRMRPLTLTTPKPLVAVAGRPMIDYLFDLLDEAGISRIVVNVHHLADRMEAHLAGRSPPAIVSDERDRLLESGGGVVKALPLIGRRHPFLVLNADSFWLEPEATETANITRLAAAFDAAAMDMLMLLAAPSQSTGHEKAGGDFTMDQQGRLTRYRQGAANPLIYCGALILHPRILEGEPEEPFSLNRLFDKAIAKGRLHGLRLEGHWLTVGTPEAIGAAEAVIAGRFARR